VPGRIVPGQWSNRSSCNARDCFRDPVCRHRLAARYRSLVGCSRRTGANGSRRPGASVLALCDPVVSGTAPDTVSALVWARRGAIWSLYPYAGVRLAERVWSDADGPPRLEVDPRDQCTLHVLGQRQQAPLDSAAVRLHAGAARLPSCTDPAGTNVAL
jgi:integrase/recombinase XerC